VSPIRFKGKHWMSVCMAVISAGVVLNAIKWPFKTALFPAVIGISVFLMSITELVLSLFEKEGSAKHSAMDFKLSEDVDKATASRRTILIFSWILIFFVLILLFSFTIGVPLYVLVYLKIQGKEKWLIAIFMTIGSWIFFWGLFVWLLDTPMPQGWIMSILGIG